MKEEDIAAKTAENMGIVRTALGIADEETIALLQLREASKRHDEVGRAATMLLTLEH